MKKVSNVKEMHENAMQGSNSNELLKKHITDFAQLERKKQEIVGKQKEILRAAKDDGFKKMAIRGAVKDLSMTEDQRQAKQEIDDERAHYTDLCRDLPLFKTAA